MLTEQLPDLLIALQRRLQIGRGDKHQRPAAPHDHRQGAGVTAFVEDFGTSRASIRLNYVGVKESSSESGMKSRTDEPILDPIVYQTSFSKIQEAIFIREGFK